MVVAVALLERRDVGTDQPRLVALDARVGVGQVDLAGPDRLDLGAGQDEAGLDGLLDRELVSRPAVERDGVLRNRELLGTQGWGAKGSQINATEASDTLVPTAFVANGRGWEGAGEHRKPTPPSVVRARQPGGQTASPVLLHGRLRSARVQTNERR
jgi:hypothetical protein